MSQEDADRFIDKLASRIDDIIAAKADPILEMSDGRLVGDPETKYFAPCQSNP
jgi:hypothetical protein